MAAITSSWLIGQITLSSSATIVVGGNNVVVPAGDYYLRDGTAGLSLINVIETGIAGVYTGSTVRILKNRRVKFDFNGNSVTLVIPVALQRALGFTGSPYGAATTRTAENPSYLLFSPAWPETTTFSPVGVAGRPVSDRVMKASATGQTFWVTKHSSTTMLDLSWFAVPQSRAWTTSETPGEYKVFFDEVIDAGRRFKLYSQMEEDEDDATAVSWTTALGPYVVPNPNYDWFVRFEPRTDSLGANIEIKAMKTGEIS